MSLTPDLSPPLGVKRGVCSQINHFPEDADFDHDGAEYVLRKSNPPRSPPHHHHAPTRDRVTGSQEHRIAVVRSHTSDCRGNL